MIKRVRSLFQIGVFSVVSLCSSVALAEALMVVGENVVVTKIDDQSISNGLLSDPIQQFKLPAGKHTVTAKYKRLYDLTADEHDVVRSVDLTVTATMQDGQRYTLAMPNQPEDYDSAVTYAEKPTLSLIQGNTVVASNTAIQGSTGFLGGIGKVFTGTGKSGEPVAVDMAAQQPATAVTQTTRPTVARTASTSQSTLDQFMQIWLNATPAEREKIKNWVKDQ